MFYKIVLIFHLLLICVDSRCSKYEFEEKVLEKMVRIEFQMERLKVQVEECMKSVESMQNDMGTSSEVMDQKIKLLDKNLEKMRLFQGEVADTLNVNQQDLKKEIDNKFTTLEKEVLEKIDEGLQDLKEAKDDDVTPSRRYIAFKARLDATTAFSPGKTLIYPNVLFNEGSAYNSRTGVFTVPVNGTYELTFTGCMPSDNTLAAGVMTDGKLRTVIYQQGNEDSACNTAEMIITFTAGQSVWVEAQARGSSTPFTLTDQSQLGIRVTNKPLY